MCILINILDKISNNSKILDKRENVIREVCLILHLSVFCVAVQVFL